MAKTDLNRPLGDLPRLSIGSWIARNAILCWNIALQICSSRPYIEFTFMDPHFTRPSVVLIEVAVGSRRGHPSFPPVPVFPRLSCLLAEYFISLNSDNPRSAISRVGGPSIPSTADWNRWSWRSSGGQSSGVSWGQKRVSCCILQTGHFTTFGPTKSRLDGANLFLHW